MMPEVRDTEIDGFYVAVGDKVRSARHEARLSQSMLARRIGFTRSSVANLEAGRQHITLHLFVLIAQALDVEPAKLLPKEPFADGYSLDEIGEHLADTPGTTQDFVRGAVAQLAASSDGKVQ
jgi:transcriptional regulator with XRE-family HTH domain